MESVLQGITLEGDYIPLNYLNPISQNYIRKFEGLVLIRERIVDESRLTGTLWYKGEVVGFTVEDIPRLKKISKKTAVESSINFSPTSVLPPDKGSYYLTLDTTNINYIKKGYVKFPNDSRKKFKSPGVVPRVGTDPKGYNMKSSSGNLDFSGIRIHQGASERSSGGCLILSHHRKSDGTLETSIKINKALTKFIYNNKIGRIVYIDEFSLTEQTVFKIKGTVIDNDTLQPIPYPKIKFIPKYTPQSTDETTSPELIDVYKSSPVTGEGNEKGEFSFEIPSVSDFLSSNNPNTSISIPNSSLKISITAEDYDHIYSTPLNADGTFKYDLGIIKLIHTIKMEARQAALINTYNDEQRELITLESPKKDFIEVQSQGLIKKIKGKLIPYILKQISSLGVPNPIELIEEVKVIEEKEKRKKRVKSKKEKKEKPEKEERVKKDKKVKEERVKKEKEQKEKRDVNIKGIGIAAASSLIGLGMFSLIKNKVKPPKNIDGLNKIIKIKNKITKQLNNLFRGINTLERAANIPKKIITTAEKTIPPLKLAIKSVAFIPSTVSTPIPVGPILIAEDAIEALKDLIDVNKGKLGFNNFQITMLKTELKKVLDLLKILDFLIQTSAEELSNAGGLDNKKQNEITTQESISKELLDSTQNQSNQLSPVVKDVNGFKMEVITIDGGIDTNLKRRQAVARNSQGIIMLKGDQSFSSNDQILIDELVYYIQQNDLKA